VHRWSRIQSSPGGHEEITARHPWQSFHVGTPQQIS
jgi:hypothetical protein